MVQSKFFIYNILIMFIKHTNLQVRIIDCYGQTLDKICCFHIIKSQFSTYCNDFKIISLKGIIKKLTCWIWTKFLTMGIFKHLVF